MGTLPILDRCNDCNSELSSESLPAFYMEDYSVIGLRVDGLDASLQILKEGNFQVNSVSNRFEITIDNAGQIPKIVSLLGRHGIDGELSDIIEQVYQG